MMGSGRFDEPDPEPVLVTIGEPGWDSRARCADIVIGEVGGLDCVRGTRELLFSSYPGLSLIALAVPPGLIVIAARSGAISWHCSPAKWCSHPLDAVAAVATVTYFRRAGSPHGWLVGS